MINYVNRVEGEGGGEPHIQKGFAYIKYLLGFLKIPSNGPRIPELV